MSRFIPFSVCLSTWLATIAFAAPKQKKPAKPSFENVTAAVEKACAARKHYRPGDILSHGDWDVVEKDIGALGWKPHDAAEIRKLFLSDNAFLVSELRTPAGRKFMEDIRRLPAAYDRLDRLSGMAQGKSTVQRLIAGPDGYKLLEYMITTPGGNTMGQMLSKDPGGKNFNAPTGRIYTAAKLLKRLKTSYEK